MCCQKYFSAITQCSLASQKSGIPLKLQSFSHSSSVIQTFDPNGQVSVRSQGAALAWSEG